MTIQSDPKPRNKGGGPFGTFGPRRRQQQLIAQYISALGGAANITAIQESAICRAVALQSIAEESRRRINQHGAKTTNELLALAKLEAVADTAVRRLKLPVTRINTRTDLAA
jgi:phosphotransferase system IIB component